MMQALIGAILVVAIGPMIAEALRGEFTFFNPKNPFLIYYVIQLVLSALVTMALGSMPAIGLDYSANRDSYVDALWLTLLGALAFQLGYYARRGTPIRLPALLTRPWSPGRPLLLATLCFAAGAIGFALLISKNGGLAAFRESRESWRSGGMIGQGIFLFPATTLVAIGAHILFLEFIGPQTPRSRLALVLLAYAAALVPPYILGFRSLLGLPLLQLLVLWNFRRRRISAVGLAGTLGMLALGFTAYGISRELPAGPALDIKQVAAFVRDRPELGLAVVSRTRGNEVLATVIHRLRQTGDYDVSLASTFEALTILIPRSLWEDKPLSTGERFTTYFFGDDFVLSRGVTNATFGGVSPTIVGEFYWHLGVTGVVVGLFLLGLAVRVVFATMCRYRQANGVMLCYALLYTTIALMAESFQGYLNGLVLTSIAVVLILLTLTARARLSRSASYLTFDSAPVGQH
jgi:hypothetical protein